MKMRNSKLAVLLLMILFVYSCEKDEPVKEESIETKIIGTWSWQKSWGGFTGNDYQTPEKTGVEQKWIFLNNDTVLVVENNDTIHKVDYLIDREKSILVKDTFDFLTINYTFRISNPDSIIVLPMRYIIRTMNDTLAVDEDVYDGYGHQFLKMRK